MYILKVKLENVLTIGVNNWQEPENLFVLASLVHFKTQVFMSQISWCQ